MGYFNIAYQIYTFMFIVATAGFPIAISKMVAESTAKNNQRDAQRIFQTAFVFLAIIGFIGSTLLFVFNKQLEFFVSVPGSAMGILAISPAVFFVAMASVFRGYFQGKQNMFPTAASEVIEALAKLGIPIISVCGDADKTVPYSENTQIFAQRYKASGGTISVIVKPGVDHHPHSLENPEAIIKFIKNYYI